VKNLEPKSLTIGKERDHMHHLKMKRMIKMKRIRMQYSLITLQFLKNLKI